jgi:hypothetical protein
MVVWACKKNGRKLNSQKSIRYEFGRRRRKKERYTKNYMN